MNKITVGIDISLDSTGIVATDGKRTEYVNLLNAYKITKDKKKLANLDLMVDDNEILKGLSKVKNYAQVFYSRKPSSVKGSDLQQWHRTHMDFCTEKSVKVCIALQGLLKKFNAESAAINIEYYSYGSISNGGSASVQIIEVTSAIKQRIILNSICTHEDMTVIPGPNIKKFAGGGNWQKFDLLQAYLELNLANDTFYEYIKKNFKDLYTVKVKGKGSITENEVATPIDDIIDAFWICRYSAQ